MLRSRIVVPRLLANGNVVYGTGMHREVWMAKHRIRGNVAGPTCGARRRDERDVNVTRQEATHEIVNVAFQAAITVKRVHRARENGHAQRLTFTR